MNGTQVTEVIEFMNEHGAENVSIREWPLSSRSGYCPALEYVVSVELGEICLRIYFNDNTLFTHFKYGNRHKDGGPADIQANGIM